MAETATQKPARKRAATNKNDPNLQKKDEAALDVLDGLGDTESWLDRPVEDLSEPKRWVVGKPPEEGGKETEYSVYIQKRLGFIARTRFIALISAALSKGIRASGGEVAGMADIFGNEGGSLRQRGERLMQRDWQDASTFMALVTELTAYTPDLLIELYCLFLHVPGGEKIWAKEIFNQDHDPERNLWGPTDDEHMEIMGRFIDQNYNKLREFFTNDLPSLARRVVANERKRQDQESTSDQSKQSNSSGPEAVTS